MDAKTQEWLAKHPGPSAQHDDFLACYQALETALELFPARKSKEK